MTTSRTKRRLERLLRQRKDYPDSQLRMHEEVDLQGYADDLSQGRFIAALVSVDAFAAGVSRNLGMKQVLVGDATGWQNVERSWFICSLVTHAGGFHSGDPAAELLAQAIVVGDTEIAGWMAALTEQRLVEKAERWGGLAFPPFALALYKRWTTGAEFKGVTGIYADIVRAWQGDGLVEALDAALEHHLNDVCDQDSVRSEFPHSDLIPVEQVASASFDSTRD